MTPTRLRQIADRVEQACIQGLRVTTGQTVACELCKKAAEELREFAKELPIPISEGLARADVGKRVSVGEC